ncbi:MAG: ABC transporter ATP-binding protein [Actinomycetales bacterium]
MIKVENLSVSYGDKTVLDSISLEIPTGTWTSIIGPNGAGKTTLLTSLLGMNPYSGSIKFGEIEAFRDLKRNIAYVPQRPQVPLGMTVREYVTLGRAKRDGWGRERREGKARVYSTLEAMQLIGLQDQQVTRISGGELQRVLIARAIVQEPQIILMDEPTSALDLHHQIATLNQIELLKKEGITVLSTMHDITLGAMYAERIILMREGIVLLDGNSSSVIHSEELKSAFDHGISVHTLEDGHTVIVANKMRIEEI